MKYLLPLLLAVTPLHAADTDGHGSTFSQSQRDWVKNLKNQQKVPCCDDADGFEPPDWGHTEAGGYWVTVDGEKLDVPETSVITPNLLGEARVWVAPTHPKYVRCFLPGFEG
jgi:hypothetical protein